MHFYPSFPLEGIFFAPAEEKRRHNQLLQRKEKWQNIAKVIISFQVWVSFYIRFFFPLLQCSPPQKKVLGTKKKVTHERGETSRETFRNAFSLTQSATQQCRVERRERGEKKALSLSLFRCVNARFRKKSGRKIDFLLFFLSLPPFESLSILSLSLSLSPMH